VADHPHLGWEDGVEIATERRRLTETGGLPQSRRTTSAGVVAAGRFVVSTPTMMSGRWR
jgi:hypothetical protein